MVLSKTNSKFIMIWCVILVSLFFFSSNLLAFDYEVHCVNGGGNGVAGQRIKIAIDPGGEDEDIIVRVTDEEGVVLVQSDEEYGWRAVWLEDTTEEGWIVHFSTPNPGYCSQPMTYEFLMWFGQ